ncbi:hypothetical protein FD03_GL001285 [Companilactobacillus nodensis DSM 19682 = JCM 14932 = NBRC 107160]|uniref:Uncharacterized protein n=2 Tax=Companilactobacillus nodensis TaxID=460870 RepID=A0A0R1K5N9_9LACO|nr:hypothetical protein FD03_GL001285 [Companilactobacillus nodensis DSM 19682 = JCM 14932 = NBRC 107160]
MKDYQNQGDDNMQVFFAILVFIIGIAVATISFKAKKESIYYLLLSVGTAVFFFGIFLIFPK